ncbi:MAG TPA: TraR/DksA family transcriptional regulator [Steroidobacteraceae bacterium]|nr:TraR/DksA family transcriptional regulator [Steroidobacteraceae bacterium]
MSIRPGCTLRPPERPNILGEPDIQPLPQSGPSPPVASPDSAQAVESAGARLVTSEDFPYFRRKLHQQLTFARSRIREALLRADAEQYAQIAGQVHDAQDESLADLLVDVYFDEIDRDVQMVRDIDAAQRRILSSTYGRCSDCGEPIPFERLDAYPTAKRCLQCQVRHEQGRRSTPSL